MGLIWVLFPNKTYQKLFLIFSCVFPEGARIDSMLYVHNGCFKICGEITVVSLVNGGLPPCFFEENVYKMLCNPNSVDLQNLNIKNIWRVKKERNERCWKQPYGAQRILQRKRLYRFHSSHRQIHGVKRARLWSYSGPYFSRIFPHSDWIRKDTSVSLRI